MRIYTNLLTLYFVSDVKKLVYFMFSVSDRVDWQIKVKLLILASNNFVLWL